MYFTFMLQFSVFNNLKNNIHAEYVTLFLLPTHVSISYWAQSLCPGLGQQMPKCILGPVPKWSVARTLLLNIDSVAHCTKTRLFVLMSCIWLAVALQFFMFLLQAALSVQCNAAWTYIECNISSYEAHTLSVASAVMKHIQ
jgi:hypothetical protein